jgi:hypothetical protein
LPNATETEFLKNGKKYYRRVEHHRTPNGGWEHRADRDVEIPLTMSRLPGPTNGILDENVRDLWIMTGSPFPAVRFKQRPLDLERRVRIILIRAAVKLGPRLGKSVVDALTDPVFIGSVLLAIAAFIAAHTLGPASIVPIIIDCLGAVALGFVMGRQIIPFAQALLRFFELLTDAQTTAELDEAAELVATMVTILISVAVQMAAAKALQIVLSTLAVKLKAKSLTPAEDIPTKKVRQPVDRKPMPRGTVKNANHIKNPKVLEAALENWKESHPFDIEGREIEQGFYVVEEATGEIGVEPWPKNESARTEVTVPAPKKIKGKDGLYYNGKRVRGSVHTHPVRGEMIDGKLTDIWTRGEVSYEPSLADGEIAKHFFEEGGIEGEHYVIAHDAVYVFDHAHCQAVGPLRQVLPGAPVDPFL